jgi:hypothetical protein
MTRNIDEYVAPHIVKYFEMWRSADKHLQDTFGDDYHKLIGSLMLEVGTDGDVPGNWARLGTIGHQDENYPALILD